MIHKQHAIAIALVVAASCSPPPDRYHSVQTKVLTEDALADRDDALAKEEEIRSNNESLRGISEELRRRVPGAARHGRSTDSTNGH